MNRKYAAMLSALVVPVLVACASDPNNTVRRPPAYATPVGVDDFEVRCGASRVITPYFSVDIYYKEDGTAKTREEFCQQYRSDTRIRMEPVDS